MWLLHWVMKEKHADNEINNKGNKQLANITTNQPA